MNLNKAIFAGRMTRDPELRVTPKGTPICQFSLAINRDFKTESGEKREEVYFAECEAWGKTGETIAKYVTKGRTLYVECRAKLDQWEDKNTKEKRSRTKFVVESFQFVSDGRGQQQGAAQQQNAAQGGVETNGNGGDMGDVPFAPIGGPEM
jgi:single-strand DNA-binding protein